MITRQSAKEKVVVEIEESSCSKCNDFSREQAPQPLQNIDIACVPGPALKGLRNCSVYCYLNAVVQMLFSFGTVGQLLCGEANRQEAEGKWKSSVLEEEKKPTVNGKQRVEVEVEETPARKRPRSPHVVVDCDVQQKQEEKEVGEEVESPMLVDVLAKCYRHYKNGADATAFPRSYISLNAVEKLINRTFRRGEMNDAAECFEFLIEVLESEDSEVGKQIARCVSFEDTFTWTCSTSGCKEFNVVKQWKKKRQVQRILAFPLLHEEVEKVVTTETTLDDAERQLLLGDNNCDEIKARLSVRIYEDAAAKTNEEGGGKRNEVARFSELVRQKFDATESVCCTGCTEGAEQHHFPSMLPTHHAVIHVVWPSAPSFADILELTTCVLEDAFLLNECFLECPVSTMHVAHVKSVVAFKGLHYVAIVFDKSSQKWYILNDARAVLPVAASWRELVMFLLKSTLAPLLLGCDVVVGDKVECVPSPRPKFTTEEITELREKKRVTKPPRGISDGLAAPEATICDEGEEKGKLIQPTLDAFLERGKPQAVVVEGNEKGEEVSLETLTKLAEQVREIIPDERHQLQHIIAVLKQENGNIEAAVNRLLDGDKKGKTATHQSIPPSPLRVSLPVTRSAHRGVGAGGYNVHQAEEHYTSRPLAGLSLYVSSSVLKRDAGASGTGAKAVWRERPKFICIFETICR